MTIIVFRVKENGEWHYFVLSGEQESRINECQYLGKELVLKGWTTAGAGFLKLNFLRQDSSPVSAWISSSRITGASAEDTAGEPIALDTRYLLADTYDKHIFAGKSFSVFLAEFQECIRRRCSKNNRRDDKLSCGNFRKTLFYPFGISPRTIRRSFIQNEKKLSWQQL